MGQPRGHFTTTSADEHERRLRPWSLTIGPRIDVAIINWNTAESAVAAAAAYHRCVGVEVNVTVVDNHSTPLQQEILADAAGSSFSLIRLPANIGFGRAANTGLLNGTGDFVVVSNADISPEPKALQALAAAALEHPDAGMIGPVFCDETNNYHDRLPRPFTLLIRTLIGSFGRSSIDMPPPGATLRLEQPSGACFLMRRALWTRCGGFDPDYFLWYEDVDLAYRLHHQDRSGLIVGSARVSHLGGESFAKMDERRKQQIRLESLDIYLTKHHRRTSTAATPLLWIANVLRSGKC